MSEIAETKPSFGCEFCNRTFLRESTIAKHICEYKHRWQEKDKRGNQIGFQGWLHFYKNNTASEKKRTYLDFIKSSYYTAFVKFGSYCVDANVLNVQRYIDWLLKNKIRIDVWNTDSSYTKFLIEYLRSEDPLDAIHRSVETTMNMAVEQKLLAKDLLRYGNKNKICYAVTTGKISPWMLYQCDSGIQFMNTLDQSQVKLIIDYIDPEKWAIKFKRDPEIVKSVKEILHEGQY
jgi:hypothetical protein